MILCPRKMALQPFLGHDEISYDDGVRKCVGFLVAVLNCIYVTNFFICSIYRFPFFLSGMPFVVKAKQYKF